MSFNAATPNEHIYQFTRGASHVIPDEAALRRVLLGRKRLLIKFGIDPRTNVIHLGHAAHVLRLRAFKDLGHKIVFIKGGFTARLGDPEGTEYAQSDHKYTFRDAEEIEALAELYRRKLSRILGDFSFENNAAWFDAMTVPQLMDILAHFTLSDLTSSDFFHSRLLDHRRIYIPELLYGALQAHDSFLKRADVEIGGTDQIPNMLLGRKLQEARGVAPQVCIAYPVLRGVDGHDKMSVGKGNHIAVDASPREMLGKLLSIPDGLVKEYFTLLTRLRPEEIDERMTSFQADPFGVKKDLAQKIMGLFHPNDVIEDAERNFEQTVQRREPPADIRHAFVSSADLPTVIRDLGWVKSLTAARERIKEGAIRCNGSRCTSVEAEVKSGDVVSMRYRFARITIKGDETSE